MTQKKKKEKGAHAKTGAVRETHGLRGNCSVVRSSCKSERLHREIRTTRQPVTTRVCVCGKNEMKNEEENFLETKYYTLHRRLSNLTEYFLMHRSHVYRVGR